jgi:hypothetical protein
MIHGPKKEELTWKVKLGAGFFFFFNKQGKPKGASSGCCLAKIFTTARVFAT